MKKTISIILILSILTFLPIMSHAQIGIKSKAEDLENYSRANLDLDYDLGGAYLCEATTGKVLYAKDEFKAASPASVTKVMTLL